MAEHLIWLLLAGICLIGLLVPGFFAFGNFFNILWAAAPLGCMVLGMFLVMLTSGLDLSLESTYAFAPTLAIVALLQWFPNVLNEYEAILIVPLLGLVAGLANGLFSVKLRVNPFLVTLATYLFLRGVVIYLIPEGVYYLPEAFTWLGRTRFAGVPVSIGALLLLYGLGYLIVNHTSLGKNIYAIGNNEQAAYVAGINVERTKILTFVLAGLFAAIGGFIETGRLEAVVADLGQGQIMMVFAATILGGTSLSGGEGRITGIFGAVLVIAVIENLLNLFGVEPSIRQMVFAAILMLAILIASVQSRVRQATR